MSLNLGLQYALAGLASLYCRPANVLERNRAVFEALGDIVERHDRWGFWKMFSLVTCRIGLIPNAQEELSVFGWVAHSRAWRPLPGGGGLRVRMNSSGPIPRRP